VADAPADGVAGIEARSLRRRFGSVVALDDVSLEAPAGSIHALLGPNGAGKTTLARIVCGLVAPDGGSVRVAGREYGRRSRELRGRIGLVPSGDRSFYLRISGLENLAFFARLHGLGRRAAFQRARVVLEQVGVADAARRPVGEYSHGMQKRLSVARALLTEPDVMVIDEATHDLDPEGAHRVRELVRGLADEGAAVLWATQRIDEIRGFADEITLLVRGRVRFAGSVAQFAIKADVTRYVVRLGNRGAEGRALEAAVQRALEETADVSAAEDGEHFTIALRPGSVLGDALLALARADLQLLACREERSEIETAFLSLAAEDGA
jgi:ABC-2 type transport system ATP-binding protein